MNDFSRFSSFWQQLGAVSEPEPVFEALTRAYAEAQRAYHTLGHIRDCLGEFDGAAGLAESAVEVEAAVWLHDVVYNPRAADNEERSADWAERALAQAGVSGVVIGRIRELILATRHQAVPEGRDAALLVDIDLSILGREADAFERYERQIRQEYGFVTEAAFREGRSEILEGFLRREHIYQTFPFRERYEAQARENLARSIVRLRRG